MLMIVSIKLPEPPATKRFHKVDFWSNLLHSFICKAKCALHKQLPTPLTLLLYEP